MKVKLHPSLDKAGLGFIDPDGQKIRSKKSGKGEEIEVKDTPFVREKLATGELILPSEDKPSEKEKK
ncbi:MAG: hypothetical protein J0L53_07215 [Spirochaetes bacterium]|nr:hypothetical protein [Spirochaetota bacterium]